MDFHALPRRDLQALCKRNGVRANMTNVAMADALAALPAVDGIEEYIKQPVAAEPTQPAIKAVAEEEVKQQGNPHPRGRRVASKSPEPTTREDGEEDGGDLKRDENKDDAPALGVGRRGACRRAPAAEAVVVAPATRRRRAAASKTDAADVAAEAVPAPTTRPRSQRTVALVADEEVPREKRTARRAASRKTGVRQEEKGEGAPKVVGSDVEITVPAPISDEGGDDREGGEEAMNPHNEEQNEAAEKLSQEDEEISGAVMASTTPVEEEPPVTEDCTVDSSLQGRQVDVLQCEDSPIFMGEATEEVGFTGDAGRAIEEDYEVPTTSVEVLDCEVEANEAGTEDCFVSEEKEDLAVDEVHAVVAVEEEEVVVTNKAPQRSATMDEGVEEVVTVDDVSQVTVTDDEGAVKVSAFTGDLSPVVDTVKDCSDHIEEDSEVPMASVEVLDNAVKASEAGTEDCSLSEEKEDMAVDEVFHEPVVVVEEQGVVATDKMPQSSVTMEEGVGEVVTVDNVSQVTVTDDEGEAKESAFTDDLPLVFDTAKDCSDHTTKSLSEDSITVEPTVSDADDVPLCNGGGEENVTEPVTLEQEKEVNDNNKSEALGNLSLRKLRFKLKETVAVGQENQVKEVKKSMALDKLSLRKLRDKLRETLIAHKSREPNRVALARLDENVC